MYTPKPLFMRRPFPFFIAGCIFLFLTGCQKQNVQQQVPEKQAEPFNAKTSKKSRLKEFVHGLGYNSPRHYLFFYNQRGEVDSVSVTGSFDYSYKVYYKGSRIDSVILLQNGRINSVNTHFQYKGNRIVQFDYYCRICGQPEEFPTVRTFEYDKEGHILNGALNETLTYDDQDNVTTWIYPGNPEYAAAYTYDTGTNALHEIENLFAVLVEDFNLWEFSFSRHNSLSKTYADGEAVTYQNRYNSNGQLVFKTFHDIKQSGPNTMAFYYYP